MVTTGFALLDELRRRNVRPVLRTDGGVKLVGPKEALTPDLIAEARQYKSALLAKVTADEALALLKRLRAYSLPTGHIEVARILARRLRGIDDPVSALDALRMVEAEFIDLGGTYDAQLAAVIDAFQGSQIVEKPPVHAVN